MDSKPLGTLFEAGVLLAIPFGIGLIFLGSALLAGVGVVLVILGRIGLLPALRYPVMVPESAKRVIQPAGGGRLPARCRRFGPTQHPRTNGGGVVPGSLFELVRFRNE